MSEPIRTRSQLAEQILALAIIVLLLSLAGQISALPAGRTNGPTPSPASTEFDVGQLISDEEARTESQLNYREDSERVAVQGRQVDVCGVSYPCRWLSYK